MLLLLPFEAESAMFNAFSRFFAVTRFVLDDALFDMFAIAAKEEDSVVTLAFTVSIDGAADTDPEAEAEMVVGTVAKTESISADSLSVCCSDEDDSADAKSTDDDDDVGNAEQRHIKADFLSRLVFIPTIIKRSWLMEAFPLLVCGTFEKSEERNFGKEIRSLSHLTIAFTRSSRFDLAGLGPRRDMNLRPSFSPTRVKKHFFALRMASGV